MKRLLTATVAIAVLVSSPATAEIITDMTPEKINEAIEQGKKGKFKFKEYGLRKKSGWSWDTLHLGYFTTPYARVAMAAQAAEEMYEDFTEADVTDEMPAPELHVYGISRVLNGQTVSARTIVIMPHKSKDRSEAIRPISIDVIQDSYQNLYGADFEATSLKAVFPLSLLSESNGGCQGTS